MLEGVQRDKEEALHAVKKIVELVRHSECGRRPIYLTGRRKMIKYISKVGKFQRNRNSPTK